MIYNMLYKILIKAANACSLSETTCLKGGATTTRRWRLPVAREDLWRLPVAQEDLWGLPVAREGLWKSRGWGDT